MNIVFTATVKVEIRNKIPHQLKMLTLNLLKILDKCEALQYLNYTADPWHSVIAEYSIDIFSVAVSVETAAMTKQ